MVSLYPNLLGADHKKMISSGPTGFSSGLQDPNKKAQKTCSSWTEDFQLETDQQRVISSGSGSGLEGPNMSWNEKKVIGSGLEGPNKKASWSEEYPLGADQEVMIGSGLEGLSSGFEGPNKKVRKPYTITKSRESWTEEEHEKFIEALQLFDRDWKKIEAFVGSKSVIQIRSHAQKYFMKVQKTGAKEHVPPPRPKRKAAHPYPQKATKIAVSQATAMPQSSPSLVKLPNVMRSDCLLVPLKSSDPSNSIWTYNTGPALNMSHGSKGNMVMSGAAMTSSSSGECSPKIWPSSEGSLQRKDQLQRPTTVIPDFAQVYRFLGSVFDPNAGDHLQRLQKMDPINIETVLTLMKNLSANLVSPAFEGHRQLLASYSSAGQEDQIVAASRRHLQAV